MRTLELLAPAADLETGRQAILHGADAVYIGGPSHGARRAASNSIEDLARLVEFARPFRARVYVTVNTIVYQHEIDEVRRLLNRLWEIGVDAAIVQDIGILRLDIPPLPLHASTQCDTRTPEKARFLQESGFSQIVLARELTLSEISSICREVSVPVECFIHGALCVSYSGRCHASFASFGRSANRGECSQVCRLPFTLRDADGRVLARDRHLLSLRDLNLSDRMTELVEAGVSSFKIEGRLKEVGYVKNVTAYYSSILNEIVAAHPDLYRRASYGRSEVTFTPQLDKSFNRGFTHYFFDERRPASISQPLTPKSMGEEITDVRMLNNGDGISFFNTHGEYEGLRVNRMEGNRIIGSRRFTLPKGAVIHRTFDTQWQTQLSRETAVRKISVDISINSTGVEAIDERGVRVRIPLDVTFDKARRPVDFRREFAKLGNTVYELRNFHSSLSPDIFIPASQLSRIRRELVAMLDTANLQSLPLELRRKENREFPYPKRRLDFRDNVSNPLAEKFYRDHGVTEIEPALETGKVPEGKELPVMTTRHCILRESGRCLRENPGLRLPLTIESGPNRFRLSFDCDRCEMNVLK